MFPDATVKLPNDVQLEKAFLPIEITPAGIVIELNDVEANAASPIYFSDAGSDTVLNGHPWKASLPIVVRYWLSIVTEVRPLLSKAATPILSILPDILTDFRFFVPWNQKLGIRVTPLPNDSDVIEDILSNGSSLTEQVKSRPSTTVVSSTSFRASWPNLIGRSEAAVSRCVRSVHPANAPSPISITL